MKTHIMNIIIEIMIVDDAFLFYIYILIFPYFSIYSYNSNI